MKDMYVGQRLSIGDDVYGVEYDWQEEGGKTFCCACEFCGERREGVCPVAERVGCECVHFVKLPRGTEPSPLDERPGFILISNLGDVPITREKLEELLRRCGKLSPRGDAEKLITYLVDSNDYFYIGGNEVWVNEYHGVHTRLPIPVLMNLNISKRNMNELMALYRDYCLKWKGCADWDELPLPMPMAETTVTVQYSLKADDVRATLEYSLQDEEMQMKFAGVVVKRMACDLPTIKLLMWEPNPEKLQRFLEDMAKEVVKDME